MANITLIASTHFNAVSDLSEKFVPHIQEFEPWNGWEALADRIDQFITAFGHELVENTILNPVDGRRSVVWKAARFSGRYHRIDFSKVVRDEYEQV